MKLILLLFLVSCAHDSTNWNEYEEEDLATLLSELSDSKQKGKK